MKLFPYFDLHCDTLFKMYKDNLSFDSSLLSVNIKNSRTYRYPVFTFALFNDGTFSEEHVIRAFSYFHRQCNRFSRYISFQTSTLGIKRNFKRGRATAILSIEGLGNQKDFSVFSVRKYYRAGVRIMSLCWNNDNILCGGSDGNNGVTPLGLDTLREMERMGIILDVSHMSDKSFDQALECYTLPFCATHSNSRHIHSHRRNLTDSQFVSLIERKGLCGINLYPPHLGGRGGINDAIRHIEHFLSLGGENNIGIGADFDGMDIINSDVPHCGAISRLLEALLSLNYKESIVNKIAFYNSYNFLKSHEISRRKSCNFQTIMVE